LGGKDNIYICDVCHPIQHPTHIQTSMTLPTPPNAIFSTLQGTQTPHTKPQSHSCKELKMPMHSPLTPTDVILISIINLISIFTG